MALAIRKYATKCSVIEAVKWDGSDISLQLILELGKGNVKRDSDNSLLFQSYGDVEVLPIGHYIGKVGSYLVSFTEQELLEDYVKVVEP